jgi:hypothetical protein
VGAVLLVPGEGSLILSTAGKERRVGALDGGWSPMVLANLTNRKKNNFNTSAIFVHFLKNFIFS